MNDFPVMDMLHAETQLRKPVQNLTFREWTTHLLFNFAREISAIRKVHYDAQLALLGFVNFDEFDDVWMLQDLKQPGFLKNLLLLAVGHFMDVDLLHHTLKSIRLPAD